MWLLQFLILAASQSHLAQASAQFAWTNIQTSVTRGKTRRTTAEKDVLAHIPPLGKLGWFSSSSWFFQVIALQLAY